MNARSVLGAVTVGRLLLGLWMLVAPRDLARRWVGRAGDNDATGVLTRAVGGRDIAFALGSLEAIRSERDPAPWLAAGVLIDGIDAVSTFAAGDVALKQRLVGSSGALLAVAANLFGLGLTDQA